MENNECVSPNLETKWERNNKCCSLLVGCNLFSLNNVTRTLSKASRMCSNIFKVISLAFYTAQYFISAAIGLKIKMYII